MRSDVDRRHFALQTRCGSTHFLLLLPQFIPSNVADEQSMTFTLHINGRTMVVKGNTHLQHAARKHACDQALCPRAATTGLSKNRGKQSNAHQRTKTQRTATRPTRTGSKLLKGQNQTVPTKGVKGNPTETKRTKKDASTALSPQARPRPSNPKSKELHQRPSPSIPYVPTIHVSEPTTCDDEVRDDQPSLVSASISDGGKVMPVIDAPGPTQSSTSAAPVAVPVTSRENNTRSFHFASKLLGNVVDSCTEDIGTIKIFIGNLSPQAIATENESSAQAKEPSLPATFPPIINETTKYTHRRHHTCTFPAQSHVHMPVVGSSGGDQKNDLNPSNKLKPVMVEADAPSANAQPPGLSYSERSDTPSEPSNTSNAPSKKLPKIFSRLDKRQKGKKKQKDDEESFAHPAKSTQNDDVSNPGSEPSDIAVVPFVGAEGNNKAERFNTQGSPEHKISIESVDDKDTEKETTEPQVLNTVEIDTSQDFLSESSACTPPAPISKQDLHERNGRDKQKNTAATKPLPTVDTKPKAFHLNRPVSLSPTNTLSAIKAMSKKRHVSFSPNIDANENSKKSVKASCSVSIPQDFEDLIEKLMCRADEALCVCSIAEYVDDLFDGKDASSIHADDLSAISDEVSAEASDRLHNDSGGPTNSNEDHADAADISQKLGNACISLSNDKIVEDNHEESIIPDDLSLTIKPKQRPNENISKTAKASDLPVINENDEGGDPRIMKKDSTEPAPRFRFSMKHKAKGRGKSSLDSEARDDQSLTISEDAKSDDLSTNDEDSNCDDSSSKLDDSSSGTDSEACSEGDLDVESESDNGSETLLKVKRYQDLMTRWRLGRPASRAKSSAMSENCSTDSGSLPSNE